jgi:hypothetical protein
VYVLNLRDIFSNAMAWDGICAIGPRAMGPVSMDVSDSYSTYRRSGVSLQHPVIGRGLGLFQVEDKPDPAE